MSRTYKDKKLEHRDPTLNWHYGTELVLYEYFSVYRDRWYTGQQRVDIAGAKPKRKRSFSHPEQHWYQATPAHWTHLYMTVPKRAKCRNWEKTVVKAQDLEDVEDCPDYGRKPHIYYW